MIKGRINSSLSKLKLSNRKIVRMSSSSSIIGYAEDDVLFSNKNMARMISLNRPQKINSLNTSMVTKITPRLLEYSKSNVNNVIILDSTSPKGLCAGGDVAECARQIKNGNADYASDFFQHEYNLNYLISTYSKPYISIMDGIAMGGGVGLSVHAPFRIVTEKTKLAMPEMDIGFFPDVGTTFFLPRLDDHLGYYFALTGHILNNVDAYFAGFATHYVPSERIPQLVNRLSILQPPVVNDKVDESSILNGSKDFFAQVNQAIEEFSEKVTIKDFCLTSEQQTLIKNAFSEDSIEGVFDCLKKDGSEFASSVIQKLSSKPTSSLKVAFELLRRGSSNSIKKQLELELIAATNIMNIQPDKNDFVKGVSHKLIEKIKNPAQPEWEAAESITDDYVKKILGTSLHTAKLSKPLINNYFGIDYKSYPFNMGLPSGAEVEAYITGNDGSGRSYLPTPQEVLKHFVQKTNGKIGVEDKVQRILEIHGEDSKYDKKYVSWKN